IFLRNNKARYVNGAIPTGASDVAFQVNGAKNLNVEDNAVDSANLTPLRNQRCGSVEYFNNQSLSGVLLQGYNSDLAKKYDELATQAEDAFVLAYMNVG